MVYLEFFFGGVGRGLFVGLNLMGITIGFSELEFKFHLNRKSNLESDLF